MTPANLNIVAVVVTYNRLEKLQDTLARLTDVSDDVLSAIVVVDNASTDGTKEWLQSYINARINSLFLNENLGGAGGFEHGMRHAVQTLSADWVVVMDDDARPTPGALEYFASTPPSGDAVAAAVRYPNGTICEMNRPSLNPFKNKEIFWKTIKKPGRDGYHIAREAYDGTLPVMIDQTSFVGLFVPRHCIKTIGYPDPNLFLYGDDVIYTMSLREAGFSISFDPNIQFEHDCMTFDNDAVRKFSPLWKAYYAYRNGLIMYRKAAGPILFWPLLSLVTLKWALAARRYAPAQRSYFRVLRAALVDGIKQNTRRSIVDVKRLSDDI